VVGVNGSSKGGGGGVEVTIRGIQAVAELGGRAGASSTTMTAGGRPGQLLVVVWRESMGRVGAGAEDSRLLYLEPGYDLLGPPGVLDLQVDNCKYVSTLRTHQLGEALTN